MAWSREHLFHEQAIALSHALDNSTTQTYSSHLQSYHIFCKLHQFLLNPTADTLSFYIVFMAHHIKPTSVPKYLSGIISSLEPHFPNVCEIWNGHLITQTLAGMRKLRGYTGTTQKCTLTEDDLVTILATFSSGTLDDILIIAIILTGFCTFLHLGKMTQSDNKQKWAFRKLTL